MSRFAAGCDALVHWFTRWRLHAVHDAHDMLAWESTQHTRSMLQVGIDGPDRPGLERLLRYIACRRRAERANEAARQAAGRARPGASRGVIGQKSAEAIVAASVSETRR